MQFAGFGVGSQNLSSFAVHPNEAQLISVGLKHLNPNQLNVFSIIKFRMILGIVLDFAALLQDKRFAQDKSSTIVWMCSYS